MSFIVKQKIDGHVYAYEAESYWDPEKKQPRQRRRYLGVWDEKEGTIKKKEAQRDVRKTKEFGSAYLLHSISKEMSIAKKLEDSLGDDGRAVLALAFAKIIKSTSLRNISHVMDDSYISEICHANGSFSSQALSNLLERISRNEVGLRAFSSSLIEGDEKALVYDVTSLSSYSKCINWLEYGDDYRKLGLPQINLGLVLSVDRKIPIYHKLFPGSVTDVVTLKNLIYEVKALGVQSCIFVLDRGFYSESNIVEMGAKNIDFVMPLPFSTKLAKGSVSETNLKIESADNAKRYGKQIYHVIERDVDIGERKLHAYILYNEKRRGEEVTSFYNRLMDIEASLEGRKVYSNPFNHFKRVASNFENYFECAVKDKIIHLKRKPKAIAQAVNRMGKMILLSSKMLPWDEALAIYRERDVIEKMYDQLKNDLDMLPLRVRKEETLSGLVFVYFIAIIIRSLLLQRARKAKLLERRSIEDILLDMGKLRAVQIGKVWKLTEVTKKQRAAMEKMGVLVPVSPKT